MFTALGGKGGTPASAAVWRLYTLCPAMMALLVRGAISQQPLLGPLGLSLKLNRYWMVAWLLPIGLTAASWLLSGLVPGISVSTDIQTFLDHFQSRAGADPEAYATFEKQVRESIADGPHPAFRMLLQAMVAGMTLNALTALGEELGWRGFLSHELAAHKNAAHAASNKRNADQSQAVGSGNVDRAFWNRSWIVGGAWGLWYLPFALTGFPFPGAPVTSAFLLPLWCLATGPLFAWLRVRSGSIFAVGILHGTWFGLIELPHLVTRVAEGTPAWMNHLAIGPQSLIGILLAATVSLYLTTRPPPTPQGSEHRTNVA